MYESRGIKVKMSKVVEPSCNGVDVFGVEVHGVHHTVGLSVKKLSKIVTATYALLQQGYCTGRQLARVIGHWVWACLVRRECLSVFRCVYRFIEVAGDRVFSLWPSVRRELLTILGLVPFLYTHVSARIAPVLTATDACPTGYGVVSSYADSDMLYSLTRTAAASVPVALGQPGNLIDTYSLLSYIPQLIPIVYSRKWSTIISSAYKHPQHINTLEMHALLAAIRWVLSYPACLDCRMVMLCDSQVVVQSLSKGRTSAPSIIRPLRKICSLLLAASINMSYIWCPSFLNPADGPSRAYSF